MGTLLISERYLTKKNKLERRNTLVEKYAMRIISKKNTETKNSEAVGEERRRLNRIIRGFDRNAMVKHILSGNIR